MKTQIIFTPNKMEWTPKLVIICVAITLIVAGVIFYVIVVLGKKKGDPSPSPSVSEPHHHTKSRKASYHLERVSSETITKKFGKEWISEDIVYTYVPRNEKKVRFEGDNDEQSKRELLGVISLKTGDKMRITVPESKGYWEVGVYKYPSMEGVASIPKLRSLTIFADPNNLPEGDYVFAFFSHHHNDEWKKSKVIELGDFPPANPVFEQPKPCQDTKFYDRLDVVVPQLLDSFNGTHSLASSKTSEFHETFPHVKFVNVEDITFKVKKGGVAVVIAPNREITCGLTSRIIINGKIEDTTDDQKDFYKLYHIEAHENDATVKMRLITYDFNRGEESLPIYVYNLECYE